jgi:hypothetical protein
MKRRVKEREEGVDTVTDADHGFNGTAITTSTHKAARTDSGAAHIIASSSSSAAAAATQLPHCQLSAKNDVDNSPGNSSPSTEGFLYFIIHKPREVLSDRIDSQVTTSSK